VKPLGESDDRAVLVSVLADSFKNAESVLAGKEKVAVVVDGLYQKCLEADALKAQAVLDSLKKTEPGAEEKEVPVKDSAEGVQKIVDAAVEKAAGGLAQKLPSLIDASVQQALGLKKDPKEAVSAPAVRLDDIDVSDMFRDVWGHR
jgi:hypothetical protein